MPSLHHSQFKHQKKQGKENKAEALPQLQALPPPEPRTQKVPDAPQSCAPMASDWKLWNLQRGEVWVAMDHVNGDRDHGQ